MATAAEGNADEIRRLNLESATLEAEARKLVAEAVKLEAEERKLAAERIKLTTEVGILPKTMIFQAMIAFAAIFGAGGALVKLFFP